MVPENAPAGERTLTPEPSPDFAGEGEYGRFSNLDRFRNTRAEHAREGQRKARQHVFAIEMANRGPLPRTIEM